MLGCTLAAACCPRRTAERQNHEESAQKYHRPPQVIVIIDGRCVTAENAILDLYEEASSCTYGDGLLDRSRCRWNEGTNDGRRRQIQSTCSNEEIDASDFGNVVRAVRERVRHGLVQTFCCQKFDSIILTPCFNINGDGGLPLPRVYNNAE